ncbi:cytochrome c maturation protein CcmE domain-containing protein [Halomicrococcus sp. SG-WS-1]|uniref:cytochrome c maturation protein CcmE domain-containing protein n=1 Tax=Halomicrococcus sp. SG-WS-1 TaxID=3439057 RepID=UPI003F7B1726
MKRKNKFLFGGVGILVLLLVLGVTTMNATTTFVTPAEAESGTYDGEWVNLEGQVTDLQRANGRITFQVTENDSSVPVVYEGTMPETMQNGRIVVAKGALRDGKLKAQDLSVRAHEGEERPEKSK